nr:MAG TPA: hypothetical protein [Caudoviricetes sp.]DAX70242.1 MAG TPA: hypothetical protein [Caudoviricetes sp.]
MFNQFSYFPKEDFKKNISNISFLSIFSKLTIFKISLLLNSALLFNLALKVEPAMPNLEQKFNSVPNTSFILPLNLLLSNSIKSTSFLFVFYEIIIT